MLVVMRMMMRMMTMTPAMMMAIVTRMRMTTIKTMTTPTTTTRMMMTMMMMRRTVGDEMEDGWSRATRGMRRRRRACPGISRQPHRQVREAGRLPDHLIARPCDASSVWGPSC